MRVHVADHPLITHKLTVLRDKNTAAPTFRALTEELVTLLAYEATRSVRVEEVSIETPVAATKGVAISSPKPLVVPILRAGLGMLEGMVRSRVSGHGSQRRDAQARHLCRAASG
jgi:uracil phosphoribosyltransferase